LRGSIRIFRRCERMEHGAAWRHRPRARSSPARGREKHIDTRPEDRYVGHGTACAGIIGALGIGMPAGLAGAAQLLPMRALGAALFPGKTQPVGIGAVSDLDMAMKIAVDLNAKVINMSFGTDDAALDSAAPKPHADVVAYALDRGCVLVAASGNSYGEAKYWPAAYPDVIAVGAMDRTGLPCAFSTRGITSRSARRASACARWGSPAIRT